MIVRNVDVHNLTKFDFFNDAKDTIRWLRSVQRSAEAEVLHDATDQWLAADVAKRRSENELERARVLANDLARRLRMAERGHDSHVRLGIENARELCELLHDSLRTAEQLQKG